MSWCGQTHSDSRGKGLTSYPGRPLTPANELQPEATAGKQVLQAQRGWWVGWALNGNMYKSGLERPLKPLKGSISAIPEDVTQSCTQDTYGNFGTFIFCCWSREGPGPGCEAQQCLPIQVLVKRGLQDRTSILFCS